MASSTGMLNASDLPEAVPLVTTTSVVSVARSASSWWA